MPTSAPHRCQRCKALVQGPCPVCQAPWARRPKSWPGNASDPRWRAVRKLVLADAPPCEMCGEAAADTADHLDGTRYDDDSGFGISWLNPAMCRPLCTPCHRSRTGRQGGLAPRY